MLQIDHVYEFFYELIFKNFEVHSFNEGVPAENSYNIFNKSAEPRKILFYDQEPLIEEIAEPYLDYFNIPFSDIEANRKKYPTLYSNILQGKELDEYLEWYKPSLKRPFILVNSEHSETKNKILEQYQFKDLYYFYHGFAALDWYRGYQALNFNKPVIKKHKHDFVSYNRIITGDRKYRQTFVKLLKQQGLLEGNAVSYGVTDDPVTEQRLVIDHEQLPGSASADIPRNVDAFWHIVTETVFYYDKLHLTEKIFKPIVSKQPFMLLAAPGNLAYLKSYGFETFDRWIDESYDTITDPDKRIEAVVEQIKWWTTLSDRDKAVKMYVMSEVIEHNFHHFYGKFKEIITKELLNNVKSLFIDLNESDQHIPYTKLEKILTN